MQQGTTRRWVSRGLVAGRSLAGAGPPSSAVSARSLTLVVAALAGLLLLVMGVVFGTQLRYAGRMYPGVRALDVSIGGQTVEEARATLEGRGSEMADRAITVGHQELRWTVTGHHVGIRPNVDQVIEEAYALGRQGDPISRFFLQARLALNAGGRNIQATGYDEPTMNVFLEALTGAVGRPVTDARVAIAPDGSVEVIDAQPGRQLQVDATRTRLEEAFLRPDVQHVELVVRDLEAGVTAPDLAEVRGQAERLLSSPLTLKFEGATWELPVEELAAMATVDADQRVRLNGDSVKAWTEKRGKEIEQSPQNARFDWSNGALSVIRPSRDGRSLDVDQTVSRIMENAFSDERTMDLAVRVTKPDVSQEDGPKLGIKGAIEIAKTSFASASPPKRHNITLAAQRLNGVVVPPGKMFSFNREVGPTTIENGYQLGWGIAGSGANVRTVPAEAGGICQVATTLFHSVFWGGYQIEERHTHAYWIPSYATKGVVGLDATVDELVPLDFRFWNNSDDHLLIQAWTDGGSLAFGLYGAKPNWTVKVTPGERTDVVQANRDAVTQEEPTLAVGARLAVEGAQDGFKITTARTVTRGSDVRTLRLTSTYGPSRNVTLLGTGGRPPSRPPATTTAQAGRSADAAAARPGATPPPSSGAARTPSGTPPPASKPTNPGARQSGGSSPARPTATPTAPR